MGTAVEPVYLYSIGFGWTCADRPAWQCTAEDKTIFRQIASHDKTVPESGEEREKGSRPAPICLQAVRYVPQYVL